MPWISMVASRCRHAGDDPAVVVDDDNVVFIAEIMRAAWRGGDREMLRRWHTRTTGGRELLAAWVERDAGDCPLNLVATWASFAVGDLIFGEVGGGLPSLASCGSGDPLCAAALELACRPDARARAGKRRPGHHYARAALVRALARGPLDQSLDLATTPDHPLHASVLSKMAAPLALAWSHGAADPAAAAWEAATLGSAAPTGRLVYRRQRPAIGWAPTAAAPAEFDAVLLAADGSVRCFHYLTVRWKAPLLFAGGVDAFSLLGELDACWEAAEGLCDPVDRAALQAARRDGRVEHVVVHDSKQAPASESDTAAAAAHYGLTLRTVDLMLA